LLCCGVYFQYLLNIDDKWVQPHLLALPERYDEIFRTYRHQQCAKCHNTPKDPALCLICGAFLCFRESCCANTDQIYECVAVSLYFGFLLPEPFNDIDGLVLTPMYVNVFILL
jgi:hypothetical protein